MEGASAEHGLMLHGVDIAATELALCWQVL